MVLRDEVRTTLPGMVRGRLEGGSGELGGLSLVDGGLDAFFVVERDGGCALAEPAIGQDLALVEQGDGAVEGLGDGDECAPKAIALALASELVLPVLVLEGEVFRELSGLLQAEDQVEFPGAMLNRPMGIDGVVGKDGEARVVGADKVGEEGVGGFESRDSRETQFLDQAILKGLVGPFYPALGLGRVSVDGLDIESSEGPGEGGRPTLTVGLVHAEDTTLVGVEGYRTAVLSQVDPEGFPIGLGRLGGGKMQGHPFARGIVDEHDQGAVRATALEPVVG